ncbi:MAG TPA: hypothetical protein VKR32_10725 [Puia sp.]|nr:hypothetical protein [Puia sp.]
MKQPGKRDSAGPNIQAAQLQKFNSRVNDSIIEDGAGIYAHAEKGHFSKAGHVPNESVKKATSRKQRE